MKILETEFVKNADKRGDNRFVQVKRNEKAAIYQRFDMDGTPREFEVFEVKVLGGMEMFGKFLERYEAYPGKSAFGRYAWSVKTLERAEQIFETLSAEKKKRGPKVVRVPTGRGRGRQKMKRPEIVFPKPRVRWNIVDLLEKNKVGWTKPTLYLEVQQLMKSGKVAVAEKKMAPGQVRGKKTIYYEVRA